MLKLALNLQSTRRPTFILGRARQRSRRPPSSWSRRCGESQRPPPSWSGHGRSSRCRPQAVRTRQRIVTEYSSSKQSIFIFKYMAENLVHRPRSLWLCAVQILAWGIALQRSVLYFWKKGEYIQSHASTVSDGIRCRIWVFMASEIATDTGRYCGDRN